MRIDAVRDTLEEDFAGSPMFPVLLTSLLEAADRVDSTTGVQMAFLKSWAPRSYNPLELRVPDLLPGRGDARRGDAVELVGDLPAVDLAYLDPPYNQHRYFTNYHVWETLVAWDAPAHYGVACKRSDCRQASTRSAFNEKARAGEALAQVVAGVKAALVVVSASNEGWVGVEEIVDMCSPQIGIHNLRGEKVGQVSHLRNVEYLVLAGEEEVLERVLSCPDRLPAGQGAGQRSAS
jgi:adenine-specific DNA-methyltransferase